MLNKFKGKRIFITGNTGFKGSWLSYILFLNGANVMGYSLPLSNENKSHYKELNLNNKITQIEGDIRDRNKLISTVENFAPDYVFHLAAQALVRLSYDDPHNTFETNVMGSVNVLDSVLNSKTVQSLVYITSDKCYLNLDKTFSFKEQDVLGGLDNYSSSKASAEIIFSSYFHSFFKKDNFLRLVSTRAGNVIGGGDMKSNRIIPDIIKSYNSNKNIILRNPKATRPWQHVLEPLSGYLLIGHNLINKKLKRNLLPSWNFGPELRNCKNVETITKLFLKRLKVKKLKIRTENKKKFHESKFLSLNINKAKKELKWKPRLNLEKTISFTADWYKKYFDKADVEKFTDNQIQLFLDN